MDDGLLSLKWNNHKTTFFEILRVLREKSNYTDATLAVEGKFYPVHKLVMSTCSEYFSDIFEKTPCKSPVIVLKDVRSHDIEALLDYMYLGEVNVNQNDLASLLKTAECLRIKGLAVPDEDPTKLRKNSTSSHDDPPPRRDSPPPKRRRHDSDTIPPPRAASPVPSPQKSVTALVNPAQSPIPPPHSTPNTSNTEQDEPPVVKVEMDDAEDQEERFRRENNYEGGASSDRDPGGDYGSDLSKTELEPENYGNASFPGPSLQQSEQYIQQPFMHQPFFPQQAYYQPHLYYQQQQCSQPIYQTCPVANPQRVAETTHVPVDSETAESPTRPLLPDAVDDKDDDTVAVSLYLTSKKYLSNATKNEKNGIRKKAKNYEIVDGILYYILPSKSSLIPSRRQVITNPDQRKRIVQQCHAVGIDGHFGVKKTLSAVQAHFYWKGITKDVENCVKTCDTCCQRDNLKLVL